MNATSVTNPAPTRPSTLHIEIPVPTPPISSPPPSLVEPSTTDEDALVDRNTALLASFEPGTSKHVLATVLITECIDAGFDTRAHIRRIAERSSLDQSHVVIVLNHATGTDPDRHEWRRDEEGRYTMLA